MNRRFRRSYRSRWIWAVLLAALVALRWLGSDDGGDAPPTLAEGEYRVERVVDGDTLLLVNRSRVRLQGVDTPETVRENHPVEAWGPEASEFTRAFVREAGGTVRLTFGRERLDRFGRFLAFVWHGDRMLNEELVRAGLARARLDYRFSGRMKGRLEAAQTEAQQARRGLWSAD